MGVLPFEQKLQVVDGLFDVLPAVLVPVAADVLDGVSLAPAEGVAVDELGGLYAEFRIVPAAHLALAGAHRYFPMRYSSVKGMMQ